MNRQALVVEDDSGLRLIYQRVLTTMGYEVTETADGVTAMDLLSQMTPDILFLDIQLPQTSGREVLEFIYSAPHLQNMYIVIVSSNKIYAPYADKFPMAEFVLKPIRPAQIRELASRAIV